MKKLILLLIPALLLVSCCNDSSEYNKLQQNQANAETVTEHHDSENTPQVHETSSEKDEIKQQTPDSGTVTSPSPAEPVETENPGDQPDTSTPEQPDELDAGTTSDAQAPSETQGNQDTSSGDQEPVGDIPEEPSDAHTAAVSLEAEGLSNLYRVSEALYRSAQPETGGLMSARDLGIKTVLSFQILPFDAILEESEQSGLCLEQIPMVPTVVSEEDVIKALRIIRTAEKPVLVHCLHGSDRTGTVVAMYRIVFENWTKEEAKAEMVEERFGYHDEFENLLELIDSIDVEEMRTNVMSD